MFDEISGYIDTLSVGLYIHVDCMPRSLQRQKVVVLVHVYEHTCIYMYVLAVLLCSNKYILIFK